MAGLGLALIISNTPRANAQSVYDPAVSTVDAIPLDGGQDAYTILPALSPINETISVPCGSIDGVVVNGQRLTDPMRVVANISQYGNDAGEDYWYQQMGLFRPTTLIPFTADTVQCVNGNNTPYSLQYAVRAWDGQEWYNYPNVFNSVSYVLGASSGSWRDTFYVFNMSVLPKIDDRIIEFTACYDYMSTDPFNMDSFGELIAVPAKQCFGHRWYMDDGTMGLTGYGVAQSASTYSPYTTLWYVDANGFSTESWGWSCNELGVYCNGTQVPAGFTPPTFDNPLPITSTGSAVAAGIVDTGISVIQSNATAALQYVGSAILPKMDIDLGPLATLSAWLYLFGVMLSTVSPLLPVTELIGIGTVLTGFLVFYVLWGLYQMARQALV